MAPSTVTWQRPGMLPDHPVLRPGTRLLRRPDGRWQAGDLVLDDDPRVSRLAAALTRPWAALPEGCADLLETLSPLLVPAAALPTGRHDLAATGAEADVLARHGERAPDVLARRAAARVQVTGPAPWVGHARALLIAHGVGPGEDDPDVRLVLHTREPDPRVSEEVLHQRVAHVWAGVVAGDYVVGPFTDPGRTACRSCVAAARTERSPGWAMLRRQLVGPTGVSEPVDPSRMSVALAWAVGDVVAWIDGDEPTTWSRTLKLVAGSAPALETWLRHPECGCSWSDAWWHLAV